MEDLDLPFSEEEFRRILVEVVMCIKSVKLAVTEFIEGKTYRKGEIAVELFKTADFTFPQLMNKYFLDISVYRDKRIDDIIN